MPTRPCLDCGRLTTRKPRCDLCQRLRDQKRPKTAERGYDSGWRRLVAQAKAAQLAERGVVFCVDCGITEEQAKAAGNPLSGDHIVSKARGGRDELGNVAIRCRRHNSSKGTRR